MNKLNDRTCCTQLVYLMDKTRCCCESLNDGEFFPSFAKSDPGLVNTVSCGDCEYGFKCEVCVKRGICLAIYHKF